MSPDPSIRQVFLETGVRETEITRRVLDRVGPQVEVIEVGTAREVLERFAADPSLSPRANALFFSPIFTPSRSSRAPHAQLPVLRVPDSELRSGVPDGVRLLHSAGVFCQFTAGGPGQQLGLSGSRRSPSSQRAEPVFRLGTGEFADSLALDPLTGYARRLVEFIRDFPNARLELKSKAVYIEEILDADHRGGTICAWSLNTPEAIAREEFRTASLDERLAAAARCQEAGYPLAFHFDPIFYYDGWEMGYREVIERLFAVARPANIRWISLGCFRYLPGLEEAIRQRYPRSRFIYADFILGGDRKMRYPQPLRIHIYRKMVEWIRKAGGDDVLIYFCMENAQVWRSVMGHAPRDNAELSSWLDARCQG
jgi:hypothetical protein